MRRETVIVFLAGALAYWAYASKLKGALGGPPWAPVPAHAVQGV